MRNNSETCGLNLKFEILSLSTVTTYDYECHDTKWASVNAASKLDASMKRKNLTEQKQLNPVLSTQSSTHCGDDTGSVFHSERGFDWANVDRSLGRILPIRCALTKPSILQRLDGVTLVPRHNEMREG
jgi:hypothetical protein